MKTGDKRTALRSAILLPLGALLLSGLLLLTWFSVLAAEDRASQPETKDGLVQPAGAMALPNVADDQPAYAPPTFAPKSKLAPDATLPLTITKSSLPTTFTVGTNNIYFINVTTVTADTIIGAVRVEDPLPPGVTWTPANSGRWNCVDTSSRTLVSCYYTVNNPSSFDQISFRANVSKDVAPVIYNTAYILGATENITSNTVRTPVDSVDLAVLKTVWPESILTLGNVEYTIVITNYGPFPARGVIVEDLLNTEYLTYTSHTAPPGTSYNPANSTWTVGAMLVDDVKTLKIAATTKPAASGRLVSNTAKISSSNYSDYIASNNTSTALLTVGGLDITKSVTRSSARVGEVFDFNIVLRNTTASSISNILLEDTIARGLEILYYYPGWYNTSTRQYVYSTSSLASGSRVDITLRARPTDIISQTQTITNAATVKWGPSYAIQRRSNEVAVEVSPGGSLQVSKDDGITRVNPGQQITYTVNITNSGNLNIRNIIITDTLMGELTYVAMYPGNLTVSGSCSTPKFCVWGLGDYVLIPGAKVTFRISAKVNTSAIGGTTVNNMLLVSAVDTGNVRFSNSWTDTNTVNTVQETKMSIIMAVNPTQAKVDENLTFKIEANNLGNTSVTGVEVGASFPAVLDLTSVTTSKGSATLNTSAKTIKATVGTLLSGQSVKIVVIAKVNSSTTDVEIYETKAKLSWDPTLSLSSNTVRFRVWPASTLPGTGFDRLPAAAWESIGNPSTNISLPALGFLVIGLGFLFIGLGLVAYGIYTRARRPLGAGRYLQGGMILLALALVFGLAGWVMNGSAWTAESTATRQPGVSMLAGTKPPLATRLAISLAPTPTHRPTKTPMPEEFLYLPTPTPLSLPDYPIPTPTILSSEGPAGITPDPSTVTRIVIPSLGLDTIVKFVPYDGHTWLIGGLKQEVAWMGDTSWPGLGGNTGLAGHVDLATGEAGPFWNLKDLKPGDEVVLYTEKNVYTYHVREQVVVNDYDMSVIEQTDEPQVTLITCTGWDAELRTYLLRLIVYADLVKVRALPSTN